MTKALQDKISRGRSTLILRDPFFATILMDMDPIIDGAITETCGTDGERVVFNPEWLDAADPELVAASMRKMALHTALAHPLRRRARDADRWQAACDVAALSVMAQDGYRTPEGVDPKTMNRVASFANLTAEEIYARIEEQEQQQGGGSCAQPGDAQGGGQAPEAGQQPDQPGQGGGQAGQGNSGGAPGHTIDSPAQDASEIAEKERENDQRIMRAAMAAKAAGDQSKSAKRLAEIVKTRGPDWREKLHAFVDNSVDTDFSWSRPNRRFIHDDMYLPGQVADGLSTLGFVVDTSGSVDDKTLGAFFGQLNAAREAIGIERVVVVYCDKKVKRVDEYGADEEVEKRPVGGGGTNMAPAMEHLRAFDCNAVICLTDGIFRRPLDVAPGAPTLFCVYGGADEAPSTFGESIKLPPVG